MTRRVLGAAIVVVFVVALVALWRRHAEAPLAERLAQGATRLTPATYFYKVTQSGAPVGIASSAIDTIAGGFAERGWVRGRTVIYGDSQTVEAGERAFLTRRFAVDSFSFSLGGDQGPLTIRGAPRDSGLLVLPTLAPIALMLSGPHTVGRSEDFWVYNPLSQQVERVTLRIAAESLFHVTDSATFDPARHSWLPAHTDTVRAWSVTTPARSFNAWVDAQGRVVQASEPGGLTLTRTAYQIAALDAPKPVVRSPRRTTTP
jgi:hypothetical protein